MILAQRSDYGSLAPLVKTAGTLMSATIAIGLSWRRRARWEPAEEDLAGGPARVAGLLTAVGIALIWSQLANREHLSLLLRLALWFAGVCVLSLLLYGALISTMTYTKVISPAANQTKEQKIVGGFVLTPRAREVIRTRQLTVQRAFEGALYDADEIWTRGSRALAKGLFVLCYATLVVSGSIALTCAAILLLL